MRWCRQAALTNIETINNVRGRTRGNLKGGQQDWSVASSGRCAKFAPAAAAGLRLVSPRVDGRCARPSLTLQPPHGSVLLSCCRRRRQPAHDSTSPLRVAVSIVNNSFAESTLDAAQRHHPRSLARPLVLTAALHRRKEAARRAPHLTTLSLSIVASACFQLHCPRHTFSNIPAFALTLSLQRSSQAGFWSDVHSLPSLISHPHRASAKHPSLPARITLSCLRHRTYELSPAIDSIAFSRVAV